MRSRGFMLGCVLLGGIVAGALAWRNFASRPRASETSGVTIHKQPIVLAHRTFDPAAPPADMPPLGGGENAECEADFRSGASVRGETRATGDSRATVTVTHIDITLQLHINVWVPLGVSSHVLEHEEGHRQISEYYYETADKLAERIAASYLGREVEVSGADLNAESDKMLQKMASAITAEYGQQLDPGPTQLLYDSITDHSRNDVAVPDAVAHALKNVSIERLPQPAAAPRN